MVYFGGFFAKLGNFAGFSLYIERKKERKKERSHLIINNAVRISEAAMGGAGDIIFITSEPSGRIHPHTVIFCVVFSLRYSPKGSAKLRWAARRSYDNKRAVLHFRGFFPKLEFLFKILILPKGKEQRSCAGGGGYIFRVQRSSIRVQRSSVGCSVSQKGKA